MNIPKKDFLLLTGLVEFHFKFAEYIRENDKDMFYRAIDYAKTFTDVEGISFDYWHEDNKKFLDELCRTLIKKEASFNKLVSSVGDEEEAKDIWIEKKKTSKDDFLGFNSYLNNFIHHSRELDYDSFDMTDWANFVKICKYVKDNPKFIEFAKANIIRVLGQDSDMLKELNNG
jgi:hypothetical protein